MDTRILAVHADPAPALGAENADGLRAVPRRTQARCQVWRVDHCSLDGEMARAVREGPWTMASLDVDVPDVAAMGRAVAMVRSGLGDVPLLVLSSDWTPALRARALASGASECWSRPGLPEDLPEVYARFLTGWRNRSRHLRATRRRPTQLGALRTSSPAMALALEAAERAARVRASLVLEGEPGTDLVRLARAIHDGGPLRRRFVVLDCSSAGSAKIEEIVASLIPSDAAARALQRRLLPSGATALLQRIDLATPQIQGWLGALIDARSDVRFVATTEHDLEAAATAGAFRRQLLSRVARLVIQVPPLRERPEDLPALACDVLARDRSAGARGVAVLSRAALAQVLRYGWPGNELELRSVLERAVFDAGAMGQIAELKLPV